MVTPFSTVQFVILITSAPLAKPPIKPDFKVLVPSNSVTFFKVDGTADFVIVYNTKTGDFRSINFQVLNSCICNFA